ncbi:MAG: PLP-dependent aminotransferase family protein [Shewanella algae]
MAKYETLIQQLRQQIQSGVWQVGDRLPSLREQTQQSQMSLMTVMHAYQVLESQGWIISRPRSGYFVAPKVAAPKPQGLHQSSAVTRAESVDINAFIFEVLQASRDPGITGFGSAYPDPGLSPHKQLNRALISSAKTLDSASALDNLPPGNPALRHIIAQRYAAQGMSISPDEIVITAGALEALNLSLQAVTRPGDWVVIENPAFYGALQSLERLGLKALSIRTHPQEGIDLQSLAQALQTHRVKACWLMTNFQNPLGCSMSDDKKRRLLKLLQEHDCFLIEDDVYSELYFGKEKPLPAKAFDPDNRTLHCGSFSKSLVGGFRVGWVAAGKMALSIQKLQLMSTLATSTPVQLALAHYLSTRSYETHLRQLRRTLEQRKFATWQALKNRLPDSVRVHYGDGGYFLWVELPEGRDTTELYRQALSQGISLAPGQMFSAHREFSHCFRINASLPGGPKLEQSIASLAKLIKGVL